MTAQERLIGTAVDQIGYMGKRSNSQLDDFKANTSGKWNKYARDLDALGDFYNGKKNGYDWCDVFVDWCFVTTFGRELGQKLLGQPNKSLGAGTKYSMNYYKQNGRFFQTPHMGDQIFFGTSSSVWHTGIVSKVQSGYVHTVEGNAGNPSAVRAARYVVGGKNILGYGRPDWSLVPSDNPEQDEKPDPDGGDDMDQEKFNKMFETEMRKYRNDLKDNDSGEWSQEARQFAVDNGIFTGSGNLPDGSPNFMWEDLLTREQCAQVLYRFAKKFGLA